MGVTHRGPRPHCPHPRPLQMLHLGEHSGVGSGTTRGPPCPLAPPTCPKGPPGATRSARWPQMSPIAPSIPHISQRPQIPLCAPTPPLSPRPPHLPLSPSAPLDAICIPPRPHIPGCLLTCTGPRQPAGPLHVLLKAVPGGHSVDTSVPNPPREGDTQELGSPLTHCSPTPQWGGGDALTGGPQRRGRSPRGAARRSRGPALPGSSCVGSVLSVGLWGGPLCPPMSPYRRHCPCRAQRLRGSRTMHPEKATKSSRPSGCSSNPNTRLAPRGPRHLQTPQPL